MKSRRREGLAKGWGSAARGWEASSLWAAGGCVAMGTDGSSHLYRSVDPQAVGGGSPIRSLPRLSRKFAQDRAAEGTCANSREIGLPRELAPIRASSGCRGNLRQFAQVRPRPKGGHPGSRSVSTSKARSAPERRGKARSAPERRGLPVTSGSPQSPSRALRAFATSCESRHAAKRRQRGSEGRRSKVARSRASTFDLRTREPRTTSSSAPRPARRPRPPDPSAARQSASSASRRST